MKVEVTRGKDRQEIIVVIMVNNTGQLVLVPFPEMTLQLYLLQCHQKYVPSQNRHPASGGYDKESDQ